MGEPARRPRLVLADDQQAFLDSSRKLLEPEFEVVAETRCGRGALDAVGRHAPDLLVLDISMPDLSGIEVLEALRERELETPVVVLTVHRTPAIADRVTDLGAHGYVAKARMARDLLPAVRAALAGQTFRSPL